MIGTLDALLEHHGPDAKAIVWEHNTHVGDARATDMAAAASWERIFHDAVGGDAWALTSSLSDVARARRGHRAIGVVYDPDRERYGNYVPTDPPRRYDAFIHVDESRALHPLYVAATEGGPPDTYPWGV